MSLSRENVRRSNKRINLFDHRCPNVKMRKSWVGLSDALEVGTHFPFERTLLWAQKEFNKHVKFSEPRQRLNATADAMMDVEIERHWHSVDSADIKILQQRHRFCNCLQSMKIELFFAKHRPISNNSELFQ